MSRTANKPGRAKAARALARRWERAANMAAAGNGDTLHMLLVEYDGVYRVLSAACRALDPETGAVYPEVAYEYVQDAMVEIRRRTIEAERST